MKTLLGENRQRYLERLKERLERRQKRIEEGLDPGDEISHHFSFNLF